MKQTINHSLFVFVFVLQRYEIEGNVMDMALKLSRRSKSDKI